MRGRRHAISGLPYSPLATNGFGGTEGVIRGPSQSIGVSITAGRHPNTGAFGCTIGLAPFLGVVAYGRSPEDAVHTAASVASDVSAMLDEHPMLNAVLPPGTGAALKGIALASQALKQGYNLNDVAKNVGPSTARVLSRVLSLF